MASSVAPDREAARTAAEAEKRPVTRVASLVPAGRLPVTEFAFNRAGAASPFGDDINFPLPTEQLTYTHPSENASPTHH